MQKTHILANRFREVILDGLWIANANYKSQLNTMDWEIATKEIGGLNTIAVLAQHVHYYVDGILNVFKGGTLDIRDKFSFDFSPIQSQKDWETFLVKFWTDAEELAHLIQQSPEIQLNEPFTNIKYGSLERNIDGLIEHAYYHLGQIGLIKKMLIT
ncbi:MAG: DUF1572 domain-containing protein [Psychroserpens sp.]|uniref:DUF1572 domain-containing protein n=1 Tax=Psychroserpens sp. TaxID=2020870 RepID=UPI00300160E6